MVGTGPRANVIACGKLGWNRFARQGRVGLGIIT
jgi:hypothetical protein